MPSSQTARFKLPKLFKPVLTKHSIHPAEARQLISARSSFLTEEAAERLIRVINRIVEEPKRLNMSEWGTVLQKRGYRGKKDIPACGTTACIAGWVMLEFYPTKDLLATIEREAYLDDDEEIPSHGVDLPDDTDTEAQELLGLGDTEAERLFYMPERMGVLGNGWPWVFAEEYRQAKNPLGRALATKKRIVHFILTGD
jgi:hypothetical protein